MKKNYYAIIPADVRYDEDLTPNAKLLYGEITALCNEKGYCWATNNYFTELYGVSVRTVQNWIESLRKKGYIEVVIDKDVGNKRFITLVKKSAGGHEENCSRVMQKSAGGHEENFITPNLPNADDYLDRVGKKPSNNTINNTRNNTINNKEQKKRGKSNQTKNITKDKIELVIKKWNDVASKYEKIPKILYINRDTQRYKMLNARYKEVGLEMILKAISSIERSRFLRGQSNADWAIRFDWFVAPSNFIKVIEGNYLDSKDDMVANHRVATKDDLARDENGNLLKF